MRERERSGVKIDFCAACKGIWLDRGELDKIIAIELGDDEDGRGIEARNTENAREARRRDDDDDDDDDDRRRDRGGYGKSGDYDEYGRKKKSKKSSFFGSLTEMLGGEE